MATVCVDASLVLAWLLPEELTAAAYAAKDMLERKGTELIAPSMLALEVPSVLRQSVHRGRVSAKYGDEAFASFQLMDIRVSHPRPLVERAWALGKTLNVGRLYDMYYLALAEIESCELWTADRRLANLAEQHPVAVRWIGDYHQETTSD